MVCLIRVHRVFVSILVFFLPFTFVSNTFQVVYRPSGPFGRLLRKDQGTNHVAMADAHDFHNRFAQLKSYMYKTMK
jgi:hypothetical protein